MKKETYVQLTSGDILTVQRGIICHGVNCQARMGSGLALSIRRKWPKVFSEYEQFAKSLRDPLGSFQLVAVGTDLYVANLFTQRYYGRDGKRYADLDAIRSTASMAIERAKQLELEIFFPKIGAGLGGLSWEDEVLPALTSVAERNKYAITIFV